MTTASPGRKGPPRLEEALAAAHESDEPVGDETGPAGTVDQGRQKYRLRAGGPGRDATPRSSAYDTTDPMCRMMFNMLATFAKFEADLIRMRTREGMQLAKVKNYLRGKPLKLSGAQEKRLVELYQAGEHATAELFGEARPPSTGVGRGVVSGRGDRDDH